MVQVLDPVFGGRLGEVEEDHGGLFAVAADEAVALVNRVRCSSPREN